MIYLNNLYAKVTELREDKEAIICDFIFCGTALKSKVFISVADFIYRMVNQSHVSR